MCARPPQYFELVARVHENGSVLKECVREVAFRPYIIHERPSALTIACDVMAVPRRIAFRVRAYAVSN